MWTGSLSTLAHGFKSHVKLPAFVWVDNGCAQFKDVSDCGEAAPAAREQADSVCVRVCVCVCTHTYIHTRYIGTCICIYTVRA